MIGIMGGTFDPVHYGHLRVAVEVKEALGFEELRLIPCREPPHRSLPIASPEIRRIMLERAIDCEPGLFVDPRELIRSGPSYTVDTLQSLREEFPMQKLGLIVGMDAFGGLPTWHRWRELPKLAHFIVLHRPGFRPKIPETLSRSGLFRFPDRIEEIYENVVGCVIFQKVSQLEISATAIRGIVRDKRNPRFLLPDSVLDIILKENLYR